VNLPVVLNQVFSSFTRVISSTVLHSGNDMTNKYCQEHQTLATTGQGLMFLTVLICHDLLVIKIPPSLHVAAWVVIKIPPLLHVTAWVVIKIPSLLHVAEWVVIQIPPLLHVAAWVVMKSNSSIQYQLTDTCQTSRKQHIQTFYRK